MELIDDLEELTEQEERVIQEFNWNDYYCVEKEEAIKWQQYIE